MNNVFIIIGGNLGNRLHNLQRAVSLIEQKAGIIKKLSSLYETEPWGAEGQPHYYNQVLELLTPLEASDLMQIFLHIEQQMGRVRVAKYDARTIDIDILFFNNDIINTALLTVPHPRLHERRFVLQPLAEIAPTLLHPVFQQTIAELLQKTKDATAVNPV